jgi:hypothetical protein
MTYTAEGKIYDILNIQNVNEKLRKREFVLEISDGQYPQLVKFELANEKCELIDKFKVGDSVSVRFALRGREWTNPKSEKVYIVNLSAFAIEPSDSSTHGESKTKFTPREVDKKLAEEQKLAAAHFPPPNVSQLEQADDLPF